MASERYNYPPPPATGDELDSPTVGPLRISKTASPSSSARARTERAEQDAVQAPARGTPPQSTSHRHRFSADDPNRPSVSGYDGGIRPTFSSAKPLPDSPGPDTPEKDVAGPAYPATGPGSLGQPIPLAGHYPPRPVDATESRLHVPSPQGINRAGTTASVNTTRAERGSPPPPETPIDGASATTGIPVFSSPGAAGAAAQTSAAAQRISPYAVQSSNGAQSMQSPQRHLPHPSIPLENASGPTVEQNQIGTEQAMQNLSMSDEPPPYSPVPQVQLPGQSPHTTATGYPQDKRQSSPAAAPYAVPISHAQAQAQAKAEALALAQAQAQVQGLTSRPHPAFAQDHASTPPSHPAAASLSPVQITKPLQEPEVAAAPVSPPPLPEGWIAHLDPKSGQYYYIHLATQATQWEFPKGPTPLALQEPATPLTPSATLVSPSYGHFPHMTSPAYTAAGYPSHHRPFDTATMVGLGSPTASVFTGPPPAAGIDLYKVAPTNSVYFGPYLRYTNLDLERSLWLGSILLITDTPQPPTIHIHQSTDLSPNPRQLKANPIYSHQRWLFYRYDIDLLMEQHATKWTYAITSHLGCTRYEFLVAGRHETNWRFITHSGNDFALSVNANERAKLGGVGLMWKDVLQKHSECGGFHAQLGLGGQIYADRLWQDVPALKQWTTISGKDNRKNAPWTAKHEDDVIHAYFHFYTSHFDQPHLREAFAQIPNILTLDDHDIFDGYGSYPDYMQHSHMFKNIGRIGIDMYLLFQHHTTHEILRNVSNDLDLFTITGHGWHFLKFLGPAVVVVGPDTRSERTLNQVMAGPTYQGLFPKVALLPPSVQHCLWIFPVPLIYPRLHSATQIANTVTQGKKAVTGTFNMLGKVTSSVAGIVGAKDVVSDGFLHVKKAVGKSGLMSGMLSPFGEFDFSDELRDMWTHDSKDLERTYIIRTLQGVAHNKSLRMTFLSGSVNCAGAGLVHDPQHPHDHKTMYQLISSAVVNAPPPSVVLRLLNTNPRQPIYVPQNGRRSSAYNAGAAPPVTDTKEDMLEIFVADPDGRPREMKRLMGRRNYVAMVAYDPELVAGAAGHTHSPHSASASTSSIGGTTLHGDGKQSGRLSLAADFLVQQAEGGYAGSVKYGPVIIPSLEYGR